jgi:hypothetical protein
MRFLRFLIAVILLPFCAAWALALLDLLRLLSATGDWLSPAFLCLVGGHLCWLALWFLLPHPVRAYVLGHELTHALWGLLFGARVNHLRVSAEGGSVQLSRSNLLITLAPYFFPFYTMLLLLARWIVSFFVSPVPWPNVWLFFVGLTWSFHICFTIESLTIEQPDVKEYGRLFSYVIIFLSNLFCICLWLLCTTGCRASTFGQHLLDHSVSLYAAIGAWLGSAARALFGYAMRLLRHSGAG